MPTAYNELGAFQFENLVQNRVPFVLVNLGTDLAGLFLSIYQMHLDAMSVAADPGTAVQIAATRAPSKETPILIICGNGERSAAVVDLFEAQGYTNAYYFKGGIGALRSELKGPR